MSYNYVLDASALIAFLRQERGYEEVGALIPDACMCTVNLSEVVAHFLYAGTTLDEVKHMLGKVPLDYISADEALSIEAGVLRVGTDKAGLSMGDRYCLALAKSENATAVTSDQPWQSLPESLGVKIQFFRSHD